MRSRGAILGLVLTIVLSACTQQSADPRPSAAKGAQPRPGGTLTFIVNAEPPSFDAHRETSFALLHPAAPHYSTLYRFDPADLTDRKSVV